MERNVLHEEATTVEAERISIDRFRQRFMNNNNNNGTTAARAKVGKTCINPTKVLLRPHKNIKAWVHYPAITPITLMT